MIADIIEGRPWLYVFPILKGINSGWKLTGGAVASILFILLTIWVVRPTDLKFEYVNQ